MAAKTSVPQTAPRCTRCDDARTVTVEHVEWCSDGVSTTHWYEEAPCPVCVTDTEEPEWPELDPAALAPPLGPDRRALSERPASELRVLAESPRPGLAAEAKAELQRRREDARPADTPVRRGRERMFLPVPGGYVPPGAVA